MSFEVSEENWLVRSSVGGKKPRFNPWDNCKVLDLGRNYQDYKHKLATNCLCSSFADYVLHVVQPCHAVVKEGDTVGQYTGTLHVKLMKRYCCSTPHWKDLQLGYWILLFWIVQLIKRCGGIAEGPLNARMIKHAFHVQNPSIHAHLFPTAGWQVLASLLQLGSKVFVLLELHPIASLWGNLSIMVPLLPSSSAVTRESKTQQLLSADLTLTESLSSFYVFKWWRVIKRTDHARVS